MHSPVAGPCAAGPAWPRRPLDADASVTHFSCTYAAHPMLYRAMPHADFGDGVAALADVVTRLSRHAVATAFRASVLTAIKAVSVPQATSRKVTLDTSAPDDVPWGSRTLLPGWLLINTIPLEIDALAAAAGASGSGPSAAVLRSAQAGLLEWLDVHLSAGNPLPSEWVHCHPLACHPLCCCC